MENLITDYTIKSYIHQIISDHYDVNNFDISAIKREYIIAILWRWISTPRQGNPNVVTKRAIELMRQEFGDQSVIDQGVTDGHRKYEIKLSNTSFHFTELPQSYLMGAGRPIKIIRYSPCLPAEEMIAYMRAFNDKIPTIHNYIDHEFQQIAHKKMLCNLTEATARGMIAQLIEEENLDIPEITKLHGTEKGRVTISFAGIPGKFSMPLDHLRARFLRKFACKRHR